MAHAARAVGTRAATRWRYSTFVGAVLIAGWVAALLVALFSNGPATEYIALTAAALAGCAAMTHSWARAWGRVRRVRGWIAIGFAVWAMLQLLTAVEAETAGFPIDPGLLLIGVVAAAAGAYHADLAGRMSRRERVAVYLDAFVVTAICVATLFLSFGRGIWDHGPDPAFLYAVVFSGIVAATLILDLAVLAEVALTGAYVLLGGLVVTGVGFLVRSTGDDGMTSTLTAGLVSTGTILVAYGGSTWTDRSDTGERYARIASALRSLLPLVAAAIATLLLLRPHQVAGGPLVAGLAALTLVGVVIRQTVLLAERDDAVRRLATAHAARDRMARQISGVEAIGSAVAEAGPTPAVLDRAVQLIQDQLGYRHVAILLKDGKRLRPAAHRGYGEEFPLLEADRGISGRVMRTRHAELVRDVARDPDYVAGHPDIHSEVCAPLMDEDGELLGVLNVEAPGQLGETDLAAVTAVADRLAAAIRLGIGRQRLLHERNFTSAILDTVASIVIVTDPHGKVVRFNAECVKTSGYTGDELAAEDSFEFLVPPDQRPAVNRLVDDVRAGRVTRSLENDWIRKDGSRRRIAWSSTLVTDDRGEVDYVISTGMDVTERQRLEEELAHRALHDTLTGLPNRALFMDRLEQSLRRRDSGSHPAVLYVDLDDFKRVNDTLGHHAGDEAIVDAARVIAASLRASDTAARLGGDEFAVILDRVSTVEEAVEVADRIRQALRTDTIEGGDSGSIGLRASVGVALAVDGTSSSDLLREADMAMYDVKARGGDGSAIFSADMFTETVARRDLELALARALDADEFVVHYQPIVRLDSGSVVGAEALVRWRRTATADLVRPAEFLAAAESTGLIVELGAVVFRRACMEAARWLRSSDPMAPARWLSVNVSPRQLADPGFVATAKSAILEAGIPASAVVVEITESTMLSESEVTRETLDELRAMGVRIAVDDFGTGYSSLSYLRTLPIDVLKLDRGFTVEVDTDHRQAAFLGAVLAVAATLDLEVVAEGIETVGQRDALKRLGCALGQGYLFGAPSAYDALCVAGVRGASRSPPRSWPRATRTNAAIPASIEPTSGG